MKSIETKELITAMEELEKERVFKQKIKNMICEARKKTIKRIMKRKQSQNF